MCVTYPSKDMFCIVLYSFSASKSTHVSLLISEPQTLTNGRAVEEWQNLCIVVTYTLYTAAWQLLFPHRWPMLISQELFEDHSCTTLVRAHAALVGSKTNRVLIQGLVSEQEHLWHLPTCARAAPLKCGKWCLRWIKQADMKPAGQPEQAGCGV